MGIQGVRLRGGAVMAASFVLLFCIWQLGGAINAGRSRLYRLPAARWLLNYRPAQPDGAGAHGTLILGQLVEQPPQPAALKFGRRVLDFSTYGLRTRAPQGYPPTPGNSHVITPPPAAPVYTPPPPTHIYNPPPPPPY